MDLDKGPTEELATEEDEAHFRERVAESYHNSPKPTAPCTYDVEEAAYWECRHMPVGSVIATDLDVAAPADSEAFALLVKKAEQASHGTWVDVKFLGGKTAEISEHGRTVFRSKRKRVHICRARQGEGGEVECPIIGEAGTHIKRFRWYPPGDFTAEWLSASSKREVRGGLKMFKEAEKLAGGPAKPKAPPPVDGPSSVEQRLAAMRRRASPPLQVSFGAAKVYPAADGDPDGDLALFGTGAAGDSPALGSALALPAPAMTPPDVDPQSKRGRARKLEEELAAAASSAQASSSTARKRSRSRSKKKKKKKKRRREESSGSQSSSTSSTSSSSRSLMAPLRKRSERSPGSVYKMLEEQALSH